MSGCARAMWSGSAARRSSRLVAFVPQALESAIGELLGRAQRLHLRKRLVQLARQGFGRRARLSFPLAQALERRIGLRRSQCLALKAQAIGLRLQTVALAFQLFNKIGRASG